MPDKPSKLLSLIEWLKKHREKGEQNATAHDMGNSSARTSITIDRTLGSDRLEKIEEDENQGGQR